MMERHHYEQYYLNQIGGEIGPLYRSSFRVQRGRGFGGFFSGLWKSIKPLFYKGAKAIGKEVLNTGISTLADIGTTPLKEALMKNIKQAGTNLKNKAKEKLKTLTGEGLRITHRGTRRKGVRKTIKKTKSLGTHHLKKRKHRVKAVDIFS